MKKDKIKNIIFYDLNRVNDDASKDLLYPNDDVLHLPIYEYAKILGEYGLEHNLTNASIRDIILNPMVLSQLLNDTSTQQMSIHLIDKYLHMGDSKDLFLKVLYYSNYNLYYFIDMLSRGILSMLNNSDTHQILYNLFNLFNTTQKLDENQLKFLNYIIRNNETNKKFTSEFALFFIRLPENFKKVLIMESSFLTNVKNNWKITLLEDGLIKESDMLYKVYDSISDDIPPSYDEVIKIYQENPLLRKKLFSSTKKFLDWIIDKDNDILFDIILNLLSKENIDKLFKYKPNLLFDTFKDNMDSLVYIKFSENIIPDEIKNSIKLEMSGEVIFDGEDIKDMFYNDRDGTNNWIKYYIDDDLWEHSMDWEYNVSDREIKQYYWDKINLKNKNRIIEQLKNSEVEIDFSDDDEIAEAALDDDEIGSLIRISIDDGLRYSDERQLSEDIDNGINELFGVGKWKHDYDKNVVIATVDLNEFDQGLLTDAFNECGFWEIKCIFKIIKTSFIENRNKPSLPEYRYGISGDFDTDAFNENISNKL